jgi:predicted dinucleotide-binding enzyme
VKIGIVGPGRIGGNCARQALKGGHDVILSFSRDPSNLEKQAQNLGERASTGTPSGAVAAADVVVLSVPWGVIPVALEEMGDLAGKIVVDTTNQFGPGPKPGPDQTAASFNAERMSGSRYVKSFNTLTAPFQAETASRTGEDRIVQWVCGDDADAKQAVSRLIEEMGYVPVDLGDNASCRVMEAPRRPGAVYGEEYRAADAGAVVQAVREGREIPPTPQY